MSIESFYTVPVTCWNCGYHDDDLHVPRGQQVDAFICPRCGCRCLAKAQKYDWNTPFLGWNPTTLEKILGPTIYA